MKLADNTTPFLTHPNAAPQPFGRFRPVHPPAPGMTRFTFDIRSETAPAFRSAIVEISNDVGARLTGSHRFAKEQALTDAASALGALRAAVLHRVPAEDPNYV